MHPTQAFYFFIHYRADPRALPSFPHDALPISIDQNRGLAQDDTVGDWIAGALSNSATTALSCKEPRLSRDRKSTRLNSSHVATSYAVFCLKKKTNVEFLRDRLYESCGR